MPSNTGNNLRRGISTIVAVLSIASLMKDTFDYGFSHSIDQVVNYYNTLSRTLFGWMGPHIARFLTFIREWFDFNLQLHDNWRHIFILIGLYYARDNSSFFARGDLVGGFLMLFLGIIISLLSAVGSAALPAGSHDFYGVFVACAIPLWGLAIYRIIRSIWAAIKYTEEDSILYDYWRRVSASMTDIVFGLVITIHIVLFQKVRAATGVSIIVLATLVFMLALWYAWKGWERSADHFETRGARVRAFWVHGNTRLAVDILGVYWSVIVFLICNAGLARFGL